MKIQALHPNFTLPVRSTELAGGYDLFMPEGGAIHPGRQFGLPVLLGFAAEVMPGHVALLLPRSSAGIKHGLMLSNTCGVIDADYRGEWKAVLRTLNPNPLYWNAGDRLLQFIIVPVATPTLVMVDQLNETKRGEGGFGSTGIAGA